MTRPYRELAEFPAWFFNLPPGSDSWPAPQDRPPGATVAMTVRGFLNPRTTGRLQIDKGADVAAVLYVDGVASPDDVQVGPGSHAILIDGTLTGNRWRPVPT